MVTLFYMQILTDWRLVVIVLMIAAVAVLLLVIEEAVPYLSGEVVLVEDRELSHEINVIKTYNSIAILLSPHPLTKWVVLEMRL